MFDMFDSNKSGWLIKLTDEVEEDAIVEVEEGIAVEAVCSVEAIDGSDTMKKPVKLEQAQIYEKWTSTWERERSKEKEKKNREREQRERKRIGNSRKYWKLNYDFLIAIIQYIFLIYIMN